MDDPLLGAQSTLQVIDETDPVPANRMEVVVRRGDDDRAWRSRDEALQTGEGGLGTPCGSDRLDAMKRRCVLSAANAGREVRTR